MASFNLDRFIEAQGPVYAKVCAELRAGRKRSHWMWYVFPQIAGLGSSSMAEHYAIRSLDEAKAYLQHPVLGPRLVECTGFVNEVSGKTAHDIFGSPDDLKFRSSMTLFAQAAGGDGGPFQKALDRYYGGEADSLTIETVKS